MNKLDAIKLFGNAPRMAEALGVTRQAIYQWPDTLTQGQIDRVMGAAFRLGLIKPQDVAA